MGLGFMAYLCFASTDQAVARPMQCAPDVYADATAPATEENAAIEVRCDLTLSPGDVVTKRIMFSGTKASGATLDCHGATLDGSRGTINFGKPTVLIRSVKSRNGDWSVPSGITVRNCVIKGALRLRGLGSNGQGEDVRLSSLNPDHTTFAQASAPSNTALSALTFIADGRIPLYLGPGVTTLSIENSTFQGKSTGPSIYLDAESAGNRIIGNRFEMASRREQIAIDGSAGNTISRNTFLDPLTGGIFLYRNCGEGGTIRHQKPQHNVISENTFNYPSGQSERPAVWLNSRNGGRSFCFRDPDHPFGSSLSSQDFAQFNTVTGNRIIGGELSLIRNKDPSNDISGNINR